MRAAALTVALVLGLLAAPGRLAAQLVVENAQQRWQAGEMIDLLLKGGTAQRGARLQAVLVDEESVPFEILGPGPRQGDLRLRIRLSANLKPGPHAISALFSDPPPPVRKPVLAEVPEPPPLVRKPVLAEVPDLMGLTLAAAAGRLGERGLALAPVAAPHGAVVQGQDPTAGRKVPPGTAVAVQVASLVPDLVGLSLHEARALLIEHGLRPMLELRDPADGPFETVLRQAPAAGTAVTVDRSVLMVAEGTPDPPPPARPWPWLAAVAVLAAALTWRVRSRLAKRPRLRLEANSDLERLWAQVTPPAWNERELKLDFRLIGHPDPGRQTLDIDVAAGDQEAGR